MNELLDLTMRTREAWERTRPCVIPIGGPAGMTYAIQLKDGSYYGQEWVKCSSCHRAGTKKFPTFETRCEAETIISNLRRGDET